MVILNEEVTAFINQYYKSPNGQLAEMREFAEKEIVPIILKETEIYLNTLLPMIKPKKILEVGTAIGYSAIYFAIMCPDAEIFTIEKSEEAYNIALKNIEDAGFSDRIHCFLGDGEEQIEKMREEGEENFDLVFLDAAKSHYRRFTDSAIKICKDKAVILSDNIMQHGMTAVEVFLQYRKHRTNIRRMREFVEYISTDSKFRTSVLSIGDGIAVSIYNKE